MVAKEPVEFAVQGPAEVTDQEPATEQQEPTVEPVTIMHLPYKSGQSLNQRMGEVCALDVSQTGTIQVLLWWDVSCFKR